MKTVASEDSGCGCIPKGDGGFILWLRTHAFRALKRMYRPEERLFVFRLRQTQNGIVSEGLSRRYSSIALIGLANEEEGEVSAVLNGHGLHEVCSRLMKDMSSITNLGDVALTLWAACAIDYENREPAWNRLLELRPLDTPQATVELAWAVAALSIDQNAPHSELRSALADRLVSSFNRRSSMFPHTVGEGRGLRSHVSCFADLVYPIHALVHYYEVSNDRRALDVSVQCAEKICQLQGLAGQWWWHYDHRTGEVIEPYPVYAIHQDAMAPMSLVALRDTGGPDHTAEIGKGLAWLAHAPELQGKSLIDTENDLVWRKVARHEPRKLVRYIKGISSRVHPNLRIPGLDVFFPPGTIDYEDRPYHLGWLLYAWPRWRLERSGGKARAI